MKRLLTFAVLFLMLVSACGSDTTVGAGTDPTPDPVATAPVPTATAAPAEPTATPPPDEADDTAQRVELAAARARWQENRPASYSFTYRLQCECDQGPWRITSDVDGSSTAENLGEGPTGAVSHYLSIEDLFDEIEAALDDGRYPIEVNYDAANGVPLEYVYNRPELPVDGGFILVVDEFVAGAGDDRDADRTALAEAMARWNDAGIEGEYDYTFGRNCFCPPEYNGPYEASVVDGMVVAASYEGTDLFAVDTLTIDDYSDLVLTVDEVFAEVARGIDEAASYTVEYDAELGYPTSVYIDWEANVADEEAGYQITNLASPTRGCSTAAVNIQLVPQPDLPDAISQRRQEIFDAAMTCDIEALAALTNADGFNASFGGGSAIELWTEAEARGEPVLLDLVQHLNLAATVSGEGADALYVWPSAFADLTAADGTGLSPADYEALLQVYTVDEVDDMFNGLGGYAGYRIGIDALGNWLFFVAGD